MQNQRVALISACLFLGVLGVLSWPYLKARFTVIEPLVPSDSEGSEISYGDIAITPNQLKIPELGIEAPVIYVNEKTEAVYQEALQSGVVHYPGTALPGELGNSYIFGHSSDFVWAAGEYKTIFAKLPQIKLGTDILITDAEGNIFNYSVTETKVVGPRDLSVLDQFDFSNRILTLQTSYPLGTALQRFIVVAELKTSLQEGE